MTTTLADKSIAILAANGFDENHITAIQRAFTKSKVSHKIIAPEQGLVNGWQDNAWGHYFTVDQMINTAMGSDFDALVIVGGERGVAKLSANPHARRIINHFFEAQKPVSAIGAGVSLLTLSPKCAGIEVAASVADVQEAVKAANMAVVEGDQTTDGVVLTSTGADIEAWVEATLTLFSEATVMEESVAA